MYCRGGSLLLLPGRSRFDLAQADSDTLRALFPLEVFGEATAAERHASSAVVTETAQHMQVFADKKMSRFPSDLRLHYTGRAKPAAIDLMSTGENSVITVHAVGRGHTALLNLRNLYLLYDENKKGGELSEILSGLVTYLGAAPSDASRLELYAERKDSGKLHFTAHVFDRNYAPAQDAITLLTVQDKTLRMSSVAPGVYETSVEALSTESILARLEAATNGVLIAEREFSLHIPGRRSEMGTAH